MSIIKYTSRDFQAVIDDAKAQIPVLAPSWTNLNEGDMGMALITLVAGVADMLSYNMDRQAEEVFLPTALTRGAVQRLTRLISYQLSRPVAARTTLRFSLTTPSASNIVIPKYTVCKTNKGLEFTTKKDTTLYAGNTQVDVEAFQGSFVSETFQGTGEDVQYFTVARPNTAENFLDMYVSNVLWEEDGFDTSPDKTTVYDVNTDKNEVATIRFSRFLGDVPAQNDTVIANYIETKGSEGNIGSGLVTVIVSPISGGNALEVTNTTLASGGKSRESIDAARTKAPRQLRTLGRAVTLQDFVDLLEMQEGIAKAQAVNHNGYVELYVAPDSGERLFVKEPTFSFARVADGTPLTARTYYVVVTAKDAFGETSTWKYDPATRDVVDKVEALAVAAGDRIDVTITAATDADSYAVYMGTAADELYLVGETALLSFSIAAEPAGTEAQPPAENTTGLRAPLSDDSMKQHLTEFLEARRQVCAVFAIFNPVYVPVDVTGTVKVYDNYSISQVKDAVTAALATFFSPENRNFEESVFVSDIYQVIMDVEGVRSFQLVAPAVDVTLTSGQIASLGTVTLTMTGGLQ